MLQLGSDTDPAWTTLALEHTDELLLEQAHLERKAASAALTFMFTYQDLAALHAPLAALAREELEHLELVLAELVARNVPFRRQQPGRYMAQLKTVVRPREPERCLDGLLVSAIIEARSCERMKLLAAALRERDPALAALYGGLVQSEARHHALYVDLAQACFPAHDVRGRLREVAAHEAEVVAMRPFEARLHG